MCKKKLEEIKNKCVKKWKNIWQTSKEKEDEFFKNDTVWIQWKMAWKPSNAVNNNDIFRDELKKIYWAAHKEAEKHKGKNFKEKAKAVRTIRFIAFIQMLFILFLAASFLVKNRIPTDTYDAFPGYIRRIFDMLRNVNYDVKTALSVEAIIITTGVFFILSRVKKIDVYKSQETWARHRQHESRLRFEMMKFVEGIPPYDANNKKRKFMESFFEIEKENMDKFASNLEEKEKNLLSELLSLHGSSSKSDD